MGRGDANLRKSLTRFNDESGTWYSLDVAASIMPAVSDAVATNLFRFSATIDEPVNLPALQSALDAAVGRFPYFAVELRRGFFWHYLVPCGEPLRVEADGPYPMQDYDVNVPRRRLLRVRARGRCIACEFHHALTDGTGGMRFLKNLLVEYFRLRGTPVAEGLPADPDVYDLRGNPRRAEYEDAYNKHYRQDYPTPGSLPRAFHAKSPRLPRFEYRAICGILPLRPALAKAKEFGVSLTELLLAAYFEALQEIWLSSPRSKRGSPMLGLSVPVNMRRLHPSATNRNFSLFALIYQDMRLGRREYGDIVTRTHHLLRAETDAQGMGRQMSRNVAASRSMLFRLLPLPLKIVVFRIIYAAFGEALYSGSISNVGPVSMPEGPAARVERFDFVPSPTRDKINVGVLSWGDSLHITFGSLGSSREIERLFFTRLRKLGLPLRVESNM
jgi:hypothetical protein